MVGKEWDSRKAKKRLLQRLSSEAEMDDAAEEIEPEDYESVISEDISQDVEPEDSSIAPSGDEAKAAVPYVEKLHKHDAPKSENGNSKRFRKIRYVLAILLVVTLMISLLGYGYYLWQKPEVYSSDYVGPLPSSEVEPSHEIMSPITNPRCTVSGSEAESFPAISARSYFVIFADNFQVAASEKETEQVAFASIVKLLGAMVAIEEYDLSQSLALKTEVDVEGNGMDLMIGEKLTVKELLEAALVGSKNDAMWVLAQNYPGGEAAFVEKMQEKADDLGMDDTTVKNPIGLDESGQVSTPRDLGILAVASMKNDIISGIVSQGSVVVESATGREELIWNTNQLVGVVDGVVGIKTGYTEDAGLCLVSYVRDDQDFVVVLLGSEDRIEESRQVIDWVRRNYTCR